MHSKSSQQSSEAAQNNFESYTTPLFLTSYPLQHILLVLHSKSIQNPLYSEYVSKYIFPNLIIAIMGHP